MAPLRADVVSGAAVVARMAAEVMSRGAGHVPAASPAELRSGLARLGTEVLDAQPAMAPLLALLRDVLLAVEGAADVEAAREAAREAADAFRSGLERRAAIVAARAAALLPAEGDVLTLSSSSTVRAALIHGPHERRGRVVVLESRPMQEGQLFASALAKRGVPVLFAVDAAASELARGCAAVLLGADSVGDDGIVNKLGSRAIVDAAGREGVPIHVATDETKILPPGFPQPLSDDRPAEEVWRAPAGVRVWNRYFEAVPLSSVTSVVTESGTLHPEEVEAFRRGLVLPDELEAWATAWRDESRRRR